MSSSSDDHSGARAGVSFTLLVPEGIRNISIRISKQANRATPSSSLSAPARLAPVAVAALPPAADALLSCESSDQSVSIVKGPLDASSQLLSDLSIESVSAVVASPSLPSSDVYYGDCDTESVIQFSSTASSQAHATPPAVKTNHPPKLPKNKNNHKRRRL